jgi:hypothetical protein
MTARVLIITAAVLAALLGIALATTQLLQHNSNPQLHVHTTQVKSLNWAGYGIKGPAHQATATFVVPEVTCAPHKIWQQMSIWVGLDGWGSHTVEQTGVDVGCQTGSIVTQVWTEMYPSKQTVVKSLTLTPGDTVRVSVINPTPRHYTLSLRDITTGQTTKVTAIGSTHSPTSAECIVEDAGYPANTFADFTTTLFTSCTADNNPMPVSATRFTIKGPSAKAAPGPIGAAGGFTVTRTIPPGT